MRACHIESVFGEALDTCRIQQVTLRLIAEGCRKGFGSGDEGLSLTLGEVTLVGLVGLSARCEKTRANTKLGDAHGDKPLPQGGQQVQSPSGAYRYRP